MLDTLTINKKLFNLTIFNCFASPFDNATFDNSKSNIDKNNSFTDYYTNGKLLKNTLWLEEDVNLSNIEKKAEEIINNIKQDWLLNGNDLVNLDKLIDLINIDKKFILNNTKEKLNEIILSMLDSWYSISNESDYDALIKIFNISGLLLEMPLYSDLKLDLNWDFSIVFDSRYEKIHVYVKDKSFPTVFNGNNSWISEIFWYIDNGKFIKSYGEKDWAIMDLLWNNNDISDLKL